MFLSWYNLLLALNQVKNFSNKFVYIFILFKYIVVKIDRILKLILRIHEGQWCNQGEFERCWPESLVYVYKQII